MKSSSIPFSFNLFLVFLFIIQAPLAAQEEFYYGDQLPDAPELAMRGTHAVGVQTMELVNKNQIDILSSKGSESMFYDRKLKVEVWYPAEIANNEEVKVMYDEVMGTPEGLEPNA